MERTVLAAVVFLAAGFLATFFLSAALAAAGFLAAVALASPAVRLAAGLAYNKNNMALNFITYFINMCIAWN